MSPSTGKAQSLGYGSAWWPVALPLPQCVTNPCPLQPLSCEWGCGDWKVPEYPCHMAISVLACLLPAAVGLTLHRFGLWESTPTAAQVKAWCINGASVYPGWAHKMPQVELNLTWSCGAHRPFRLLNLGMDHPEGLSFHRHSGKLQREAWECLGARA